MATKPPTSIRALPLQGMSQSPACLLRGLSFACFALGPLLGLTFFFLRNAWRLSHGECEIPSSPIFNIPQLINEDIDDHS